LVCANEGADSILVYVADGADEKPFDLMFFSNTSFDRFLDACARLGCNAELLAVEHAGVLSPSVEMMDSSWKGVALPLLSCVAAEEASFRTASPRMALMFLFRR
jgi:hypothetical protein